MFQLLRHLARERPDVIHFQWTPLASIDSRFIPQFRRIAPTILTAHDSKPYNDNPRSRLQRLGATEIFRRFDHVIVHTKAARQRMIDYGVNTNRVSIVPHGLLLEPFRADTKEVRQDRRVEILLFGQIKPYKGADVLIRAIGELPEPAKQRCRVRIVGRPEMNMQPLLDLVNQLGLRDIIEFDLRFVPDSELPKLMTDADIHVFPYREIDASGVLMLGLAAGRPVVASRIGLFEELLGDLKLNKLIEPNSPAALASALAPLIADDSYRSGAAREIIQMRGSISNWGEIATRTISVYDKARNDYTRQAGH
jgi:glycosyltransferase involved in cell wall biosynthesis